MITCTWSGYDHSLPPSAVSAETSLPLTTARRKTVESLLSPYLALFHLPTPSMHCSTVSVPSNSPPEIGGKPW